MADPLIPRRDLDFMLKDWLGLDAVLARGGSLDMTDIDAVLDLAEQVAEEAFLPHYKTADQVEPRLEDGQVHILPEIAAALTRYAELGLFAAAFPEDRGGLGLPKLAYSAAHALFAAANVAAHAYAMLTVANARLILSFGTAAQIDAFAAPELAGRWFGTMCLSEPQAGSSLGDVRTRAVADGADELGDRYRLTGNKMWISGGDQDASENIVHLVLAKVAGADGALPEGTKGISLFIVPKMLPDGGRNDVAVAGLNHKMGYRGTANCLLNLGEAGGAIGWRVGAEGDGLMQMFQMMNEARIGVGLGAAALGYRGYRHAARYARERTQGRTIGARGGLPVALVAHADVRRMLLQAKAYVEGALGLCLYCARLVDDEEAGDGEAAALLGLLTPVAKTWPSEYGLIANDIAIQVHGGYGYTRDFDVEQLWRDNRLNPIHEGTTGIQGLDLLGRKILRDDGRGLAVAGRRIAAAADAAPEDLSGEAAALRTAWARIAATVAALARAEGVRAFDDATLFLRAFGHVVVAWLWLEQATAAAGDDAFHAAKRRTARFFFATELPQALLWLDLVAEGSDLASAAPEETFA